MRKRLLSVLTVATLGMVMSGCASSINLSDQDLDLVAEYVSSVVVRYDNNDNGNKLIKLSDTVVEETPSATDNSELNEETEETTKETLAPSATAEAQETDSDDTASKDQDLVDSAEKITMESLYSEKDISITYKDVKEYKIYPKTDAADALTAANGKKFVVVAFTLKNNSSSDVSVDLLKSKVSFLLKANDSEWCPAALTLLDNDMTYYQGTIKKNGTEEVVVLFEVKESLVLSKATLYAVSGSNKASEVSIK